MHQKGEYKMKKRIGIIGIGMVAKKHINQLMDVDNCEIIAICDIDPEVLSSWGDKLGIDEAYRFSDYNDLINCEVVDAVEICTPNYLHVPMALAVVKAKKPVNLEKPLSVDLASSEALMEALKENPVDNMMCFSYRFMPAVRYAKKLLDTGIIGDIISVDVAYLKSSAFFEGRRLEWRFVKEYAGSGVLGDLGVHLIDMAELLCGKILKVSAMTEIVVKERKKLNSEEYAPVETDDYCSFIAEMDNNIKSNFVITRCARGHSNTIKFDIYGTKGIVSFDLNNPDVLKICAGEIDLETETIRTVKVPSKYNISQEQAFIDKLNGKECDIYPTIYDGYHSQRVLDAVFESAEQKCWVNI